MLYKEPMELTQKQETFTQLLFEGKTQREAWVQAGYSSKYAPAIIDVNACKLANSNKVKLRLGELNKPIIARAQATKEAKLGKLEEIFSHEPMPDSITARDRILAIAEHNKMEKVYEPDYTQEVKVQTFVFILPDGTKVAPKELMSGQ